MRARASPCVGERVRAATTRNIASTTSGGGRAGRAGHAWACAREWAGKHGQGSNASLRVSVPSDFSHDKTRALSLRLSVAIIVCFILFLIFGTAERTPFAPKVFRILPRGKTLTADSARLRS